MSLDAREVGGVPRMIQMYFQYDSTLSYTQKGGLVCQYLRARTKQPVIPEISAHDGAVATASRSRRGTSTIIWR